MMDESLGARTDESLGARTDESLGGGRAELGTVESGGGDERRGGVVVDGRRRRVCCRCFRVKLRQELLQHKHALLHGRPLLGVLPTK
jgi:hypothetical protein